MISFDADEVEVESWDELTKYKAPFLGVEKWPKMANLSIVSAVNLKMRIKIFDEVE